MSQSNFNEKRIPVTVHLSPSTVKELQKVSDYLTIRHRQEKSIERVIKGALADYLDLMYLYSEEEIAYIKTLIADKSQKGNIKNHFKDIMKQKGLRAADLHRITDISESNLSLILNNKNTNLGLDSFIRIWLALDCPPLADCLYKETIESESAESI